MVTENTTIQHAVESRRLVLSRADLNKQVRRMALAVPATALLMGAAVMTIELRFGLLAAAFILGWTQLVGL